MSEVSLLITTNKKFLIEGSVENIIDKIQAKSIDSQTGKLSKWFYFYELKSNHLYTESTLTDHNGYECFVKTRKVAVKKTAIKSIVNLYNDFPVLTAEELSLHNSLALKKALKRDHKQKEAVLKK